MLFNRRAVALALILLSGTFISTVEANTQYNELKQQITALIVSRHHFPAEAQVVQRVTITTPPEQLTALCRQPELSVAGNNGRLTGNKSIIARCDNRRKFIQVKVHAEGRWWVAAQAITPGSVLSEQDIVPRSGSLERQPADLLFDKNAILGQTATRTINGGQAISRSQLRRPWVVLAGQEVDIIAHGEGFQIRSRGKALTNAAAEKPLRVATRSGQIVSGVLSPEGTVNINLKE